MRFVRDACAVLGDAPCCITIGAFDGVHLGHQALMKQTQQAARTHDAKAVVLSFHPLPRQYFQPEHQPLPRLTTWRQKHALFDALGMDAWWMMRFNQHLAQMPAETFIQRVLLDALHLRWLCVGADFRFGKGRVGDVAMLRAWGQKHGFEVHVPNDVCLDGKRVSSSWIRAALGNGDFDLAAQLLGRRFAFEGHVVRDQQLARTLGMPTANLKPFTHQPPLRGIFAAKVHGDGLNAWPGVASLGTRPTVGGVRDVLEVHLFDFDGDLYGQHIAIEPVAHIRDEAAFDDLDALKKQMFADAEQARSILF